MKNLVLIAPYCLQPNHSWFSPGRTQKILQVEALLVSLGYSLIRINTSPAPYHAGNFSTIQLSRSFVPLLRLFHSIYRIFCFAVHFSRSQPISAIWVYNSKFQDFILVLILLLFFPHSKLFLQIEDLPYARTYNAGFRGFLDSLTLLLYSSIIHKVFAVSTVVSEELVRISPFKPASIVIFPPSLPADYISILQHRSRPFSKQYISILYAGDYTPEKGVDILLSAFTSLPPSEYVLKLAGPIPDNIRETYSRYPNIRLLYHLGTSQLYYEYSCTDILVCPHLIDSMSTRIFPFKLIEYAASGSLLFTTRMPGINVLDLPEFCFFESQSDLTAKLLSSRLIWNEYSDSIFIHSRELRQRFNYLSIQHSLHPSFL